MYYSSLALIHALVLIAGSVFALRHFSVSRLHKILAGFLLVWFNLVMTGYGLGLFSKLNNVTLYLAVSCFLAAGGGWALDIFLRKKPAAAYCAPALEHNDAPWDFSRLMIFSLAVLTVATIGSALIALFYYPNNPDSIAYRFARVFLYLGKGNLMHPAHNDPRISFYPFDGALAYVYFAIYRLDGRWFNFLGYSSWLISFLGVYILARDIGGSRNGSYWAAYIYALSPIVLVLATSTNDELIAATPVLLGLIFLHRWWYTGKSLDAVLGGIGIGLGAGTKLHIAFFWPVIVVAMLWIAVGLYRKGALGRFFRERLMHIAATGLLVVLLVSPFIIINLIESKQPIVPTHFVAPLLNKPFDIKVAMINISLFSAQLFLSPVPELVISPDTGLKNRVFGRFNSFFNKKVFSWVDKNDHYSCEPYYYFQGVASPVGWWVFEETVWLGFAPFLLLLGVILLWGYRDAEKTSVALWLLTGFFVWHFYKSATTKYVEAASTYYSYPFTICAAGLAILWDRRDSADRYLSAALKYLFVFVIITHSLFAINILACNVRRNLTSLVLSSFSREAIRRLPLPSVVVSSLALAQHVNTRLPMPDTALKALRDAKKIHLVYTRWEFPFFNFMIRNPAANFTSSSEMVSDEKVLNILLYAARSEFAHIPMQVRGEDKERLTALGSINAELGTEYIFGKGNDLNNIYPDSSGFIVLHPALKYSDDGLKVTEITFSPGVMGTGEADHFEYRLSQISADNKEYSVAGWFPQNQLDQPRKLSVPSAEGYLKVQVRSADDPNNIFESVLPLKKGEDVKHPNLNPVEAVTAQLVKPSGAASINSSRSFRLDANMLTEAFPAGLIIEGMGPVEGPYAQWALPKVRWAKERKVRIQFDNTAEKEIISVVLSMKFRPQVRPSAGMTVAFNGQVMKSYSLRAADKWYGDELPLTPQKGRNIIELSFGLPGEPKLPDSLYMLFKTLSLKVLRGGFL